MLLTPPQEMCLKVGELLVHVGTMGAALEGADGIPDDVKENWEEKVNSINEYLDKEIEEIQQFGEYFD